MESALEPARSAKTEAVRDLPPPRLPLARYELRFRAVEPVVLPAMAGVLWRGVLGRALRHMADGDAPLPTGMNSDRARALYRDLFETPPPPDAQKMRRYEAVPHAYALYADDHCAHVAAGSDTLVGMTLVGQANAALPGILAGYRRAGEDGIGKSRGRMVLEQVDAVWRPPPDDRLPVYRRGGEIAAPPVEPPVIPPMPRFVEVRLLSPLRVARSGRVVGADEFHPRDMLGFLVRRVSMLSTFHTTEPHDTDFRRLKETAARARMVERNLGWREQTRWSPTLQEEIPMGGLVGWFILDLTGLSPLWPYLWLAPWLHAGKGATMGQGAVALRPA